MKRKIITCLILGMCFFIGCGNEKRTEKLDNKVTSQTEGSTEIKTESDIIELVETETEEIEPLTEDEYKSICQEMYNEDVFAGDLEEGQHLKIYGYLGEKGSYVPYDTFAIIIDDICKEYELERDYFVSGVLFKEGAERNVPMYVGERVYLLFDKAHILSAADFEVGEEVVIYGEVVQLWSGPFIIPRYMEVIER